MKCSELRAVGGLGGFVPGGFFVFLEMFAYWSSINFLVYELLQMNTDFLCRLHCSSTVAQPSEMPPSPLVWE